MPDNKLDKNGLIYALNKLAEKHLNVTAISEAGVHGIRYYNDKFQGYDPETNKWFDISDASIHNTLEELSAVSYEIRKQATAEDGFVSTYQLFKNETAAGAKINIPKDIFVQDISDVLVCSTTDIPKVGFQVGDKYVVFTVEVTGGTTNKLYLNLKDLVDAYIGSYAIGIGANNTISLIIDTTNANGLEIGTDGLKLNPAKSETDSSTGDITYYPGAMTAADKERLDNAVNAIGTATLTTDATTLKEAVNELKSLIGTGGSGSSANIPVDPADTTGLNMWIETV